MVAFLKHSLLLSDDIVVESFDELHTMNPKPTPYGTNSCLRIHGMILRSLSWKLDVLVVTDTVGICNSPLLTALVLDFVVFTQHPFICHAHSGFHIFGGRIGVSI